MLVSGDSQFREEVIPEASNLSGDCAACVGEHARGEFHVLNAPDGIRKIMSS